MQVMKQGVNQPLSAVKQVAIIFAGVNGYLDDIPADKVGSFENQLHLALDSTYAGFVKLFNERKALTDDVKAGLTQLLTEFKRTFKPE